ncbi:uncharacterized protein LOC132194272 [Neocloeon triangulifer]|uniref:uncharacterized protein LOC132194272 n=1 Tax=Neocloeon triangulifer TaxID=2078957 RepID=UPI00286F53CE|nr:uncharacterized protein LOC132194272 [Neocloeon triangulifer]
MRGSNWEVITPRYERESEEIIDVEVGKVSTNEKPWSFSIKVQGDQTTFSCQLQDVQDLPIADHFTRLADILHGKFEMVILGHIRKTRLVQLLMPYNGSKKDVAQYLTNCYKKQDFQFRELVVNAGIADPLPHVEKFFASIEKEILRKEQQAAQMNTNSHFKYSTSDEALQSDSDTFTSHNGPNYNQKFSKGYNSFGTVETQYNTGLPEMIHDHKLKTANFPVRPPSPARSGISSVFSSSSLQTPHSWEPQNVSNTSTRKSLVSPTSSSVASKSVLDSWQAPIQAVFAKQNLKQLNGSTICCYITHIDDPGNFYVAPEESDEFQKQLEAKYGKRPKEEFPKLWKNKAFVAFVDGQWQRAIVASPYLGHTIEVFLVDTGKLQTISKWALHRLDHEDAAVPPKAICCTLRGVHRQIWSHKETEALKNLRRVEAIFVSDFGDLKKFSTIITKADGTVVNCLLGSPPFEILKKTYVVVKDIQLFKGQEYEARLVGPWGRRISLQLKNRDEELKFLEEQLKSAVGCGQAASIRDNDYIVVFEIPFHRRAIVKKMMFNSATVLFIDHGITKEVPLESLQPLPEHFMIQPAFAVPCIVAEGEQIWPRQEFIQVKVIETRGGQPVVACCRDSDFFETLKDSSPTISSKKSLAASFANVTGLTNLCNSKPREAGRKSSEKALQATVTHVQSSTMAFVQLDSRKNWLSRLEAEINDLKPFRPVDNSLHVGGVYLSQDNGRWLRAEVLPDGKALFLDYGHRGLLGRVCHLPEHLKIEEPAAKLCLIPNDMRGLSEGSKVLVALSDDKNEIIRFSSEEEQAVEPHAETNIVQQKKVAIGSFQPPCTVWLITEPQIFEEMCERLQSLTPQIPISKPGLGEVYAVQLKEGWFRGRVTSVQPLETTLLDSGRKEDQILTIMPLSSFLRMVEPLAKPYELTEDEITAKCTYKLQKVLTSGQRAEALILNGVLHGLWVDGQNALEAAGHLIKVEVVHKDTDGAVWVSRKTKAERRTERLQPQAPGLNPIIGAERGLRCVAQNFHDGRWYRAEIMGHTRFFHILRLIDFGTLGESVDLREWWGKSDVDARKYKQLKNKVEIGQVLLTSKILWSETENPALFDLQMTRVD